MKVGIVINEKAARGGSAEMVGDLRARFAAENVPASVSICCSHDLMKQVDALLKEGVDALVAGGGDGTLSSVAETCVKIDLPMGILPLGTHNHFARDAQLPLDLEGGIRCIAKGKTRRIDLGAVNEHYFINNSSVGAYPKAVEERKELQKRLGLRKQVAGIIATLRVFAREPKVNALIEIDGEAFYRRGPFVFVGNNEYSMRFLGAPRRDSLTAGKLCVYTAQRNGVSGLLKFMFLAIAGRLGEAHGCEKYLGEKVTVRLPKETARVSKDGEVLRMAVPLEYRIVPRALQIFAPA
jgi:diacylglycerol kinase family enzyme